GRSRAGARRPAMTEPGRVGARRAPGTELDRCLADGGVVVFPTDTVYGLGCDVENPEAVRRLYTLKGRPREKPAAVLWGRLEMALADLDEELGPRTRAAVVAVLPGAFTLLLPNPGRRYALAGGEALGLRVPATRLPDCRPLLQSSANLAGGPDPRRLDEVPTAILDGADLVLDGGELPGTPSTVIDLTGFEATGSWRLVRSGALGPAEVAALFGDGG
ncbi:MAG: L-threonylcarbamoyladenylate synthase, partial [Actinobacteria bacterium]|nr:L-threonylcarbamoyladenylate synthase [Actinomycetota bacterium]